MGGDRIVVNTIMARNILLVPSERRLALAMDACVATTEASLDTPGIAFLEVVINECAHGIF